MSGGGKARAELRNMIRCHDLPSSLSQTIINRLEVFGKHSCYLAGISSLLKSESELTPRHRERVKGMGNQPGLGTRGPQVLSLLPGDQLVDLQGDIVMASNNYMKYELLLLV